MRRPLIALVVLASCLTLTSEAATSSRVHRHVKRSVRPRVQQHVSFIPVYHPSETITRLQTPLTGRVVEQVPAPPEPVRPRYIQVFLTPEQQAALEASRQPQWTQPLAIQLKTGHSPWRWFHWNVNRPQRLRVRPEALTSAHSFVVPLTSADAAQLTGLISAQIQAQVPDVNTPLMLSEVPASQAGNPLTLTLQYTLKSQGYSLDSNPTQPGATVRYRVSYLDKALLLRVRINGIETARLYERSASGTLATASPITRFNRREP